MQVHEVVLIAGDGIGPEVTDAVEHVLSQAGAAINWVRHVAGQAAIDAGLDVLPQATLDAITTH